MCGKVSVFGDWMYSKKVDKYAKPLGKREKRKENADVHKNSPAKYSEDFKKAIVTWKSWKNTRRSRPGPPLR